DHFAYDPKLTQLSTNVKKAQSLLDKAGWKAGEGGIRVKGEQRLKLRLHTMASNEFTRVAENLKRQWQAVGVEVEVIQPSENELQSVVAMHNYDMLLYGISLGVDPDVFAYWHSSQADP